MTEENKKIFSGTEVGVLIEDFDKKLDVVAEGVLTLDRKVDGLAERMDGLEDRLDKIDVKIALINEEVVEIKARLDRIENGIDKIADTGRLEDIEKRIAKLEAEQKELRSRVGTAS